MSFVFPSMDESYPHVECSFIIHSVFKFSFPTAMMMLFLVLCAVYSVSWPSLCPFVLSQGHYGSYCCASYFVYAVISNAIPISVIPVICSNLIVLIDLMIDNVSRSMNGDIQSRAVCIPQIFLHCILISNV